MNREAEMRTSVAHNIVLACLSVAMLLIGVQIRIGTVDICTENPFVRGRNPDEGGKSEKSQWDGASKIPLDFPEAHRIAQKYVSRTYPINGAWQVSSMLLYRTDFDGWVYSVTFSAREGFREKRATLHLTLDGDILESDAS